MPIRNKLFKAYLAGLMWQAERKAPGIEALNGALNIVESIALFQGKRHTLYNRVAPDPDGEGIWIDMCDEKWRAIRVTTEGWKVVDNPPILFKRYNHQLPLVEPKQQGDPWHLLTFFNIDQKDDKTRLTLLVTCISFMIPTIPHPVIVVYGIQGSAKSWLFRFTRRLLDPSSLELLTLPRDERERVQQLDHHWLAFYDNVTSIPPWMSDTLCRAATGGGFSKRELYTDDDDVIYNFKRCLGLNGINIAAQAGDLLDRCLLVGLEHIPNDKRRTEADLEREFGEHRAEILGGFLDTLVKALQIYPSVNPNELFRMADFTRWGCAIALALGSKEKDFIKAYEEKVEQQIEEAAHASPVATVLLDFMRSRAGTLTGDQWKGTPTQLFTELLQHAKLLDINTRQHGWPKAPHSLVRRLNELAPSLKSLGWEVQVTRSGTTRNISINSVTSVTSESSGDSDASDATSPTSKGQLSIQEIREKLRFQLPEGREEDFISLAQENGLSLSDAEKLFDQLKEDDLIWQDRNGETVWRWVK